MIRKAMKAPTGAAPRWRAPSVRRFRGCTVQPFLSAVRSAFSAYSILTSSTSKAMTKPEFKPKTFCTGLALVFLVGLSTSAWSVWPTDLGGIDKDVVTASDVGPSGDVFVTGTFSGEATFGSGTQLSARGTQDIVVARYNAAGNLVWAKRAGGKYADSVNGLVVDGSGNVYITGAFVNKADFGSIEVESEKSTDSDVFVAKLDGAGSWSWVRVGRGKGDDVANGIGLIKGSPTSVPPVADTLVIGGAYECEAEFEPLDYEAP